MPGKRSNSTAPRPRRVRKKVERLCDELERASGGFGGAVAAAAPVSGKTSAVRELQGKASYRPGMAPKQAPAATVLAKRQPLPKRHPKTGQLLFTDHPEFRPNLTPAEVLQLGSFGGTYFRPIDSGTTHERYMDAWKEFPAEWFEGLNIKRQVTRSWASYDVSVNKYGVKCGGTLDMWESSGWISTIDPYGWFQWFCRFYLGRRSTDDERQIARGNGTAGPKGRFRNQLIGKCSQAGTTFDDATISPVIRQSLQHWGYTLTQADADAYVKAKKLRPLKRP